MTTSERVRVAVVGAGRWAQVAHIPGWQREPRAEVVALADIDAAVAGEVAAKFSVQRGHRRSRAARRSGPTSRARPQRLDFGAGAAEGARYGH